MNSRVPRVFSLCVLSLLAGAWLGVVHADVRLPHLFSDHMVLQQRKPIAVWGWADPGEKVTVTLDGKRRRTTTDYSGRWEVRLPSRKAGGPVILVVEGRNRIELQDVLIGEVWICSGQSNMEWPMHRAFEPESDIANATHPEIRLFTVPKLKAVDPVPDVDGAWQKCEPSQVRNFSAVAYYFGRELQSALNVPVGLIHTSWGGSPAEVWMRWNVLATHPDYLATMIEPWPAREQQYRENLAAWEAETEALKQQDQTQKRPRPQLGWRPAELYNGMIAPLIPYTIAGAIWYQGESNAGRAHQYRHLFPNLIQNWRDDWGQGDFPFLAVQLAPWDKNRNRAPEEIAAIPTESDWAELREAQLMAAQTMKNVGLAVITDYGDKDDIHPAKKAPVGERLALLARHMAYGHRIVPTGPVFNKMKVKDDQAILYFDHVGSGLQARGGNLRGFSIAGEDRQFFWAQAQIDGKRVIVSHPVISKPVAVRYGWADYPIVNLFNAEGLPATPFRTDDFPMVTAPKE